MNSKQKGDITELECILAFKKRNFTVSIPYGEDARYDFIADVNGRLLRIQSKTSISNDEGDTFSFSTRSCNASQGSRKYNKSEIDYFATIYDGDCYLIPVEVCGSVKKLRKTTVKNGQDKNISWAKDYEIDKVLCNII